MRLPNPYPGETIRQSIMPGEQGGVPVLPPVLPGQDITKPAPTQRKPLTLRTILEALAGIPARLGAEAGTLAGGGSRQDALKAGQEAAKAPLKAPAQMAQEAAGEEGAATFWFVNLLLVVALVLGGLMLLQQAIPTPAKLLK